LHQQSQELTQHVLVARDQRLEALEALLEGGDLLLGLELARRQRQRQRLDDAAVAAPRRRSGLGSGVR